ncbi:MAG: hypothetical protein WAQ52_05125 [Terriglobales bacterium]
MANKRRVFMEFLLGIIVYFTGFVIGVLLVSSVAVIAPFPRLTPSELAFWELLLLECVGVSVAFFMAGRILPVPLDRSALSLGWGLLNPVAGLLAVAVVFATFVRSHILQRGFAQAAWDMQENLALGVMLLTVVSTVPSALGYYLGSKWRTKKTLVGTQRN